MSNFQNLLFMNRPSGHVGGERLWSGWRTKRDCSQFHGKGDKEAKYKYKQGWQEKGNTLKPVT